MVVRCSFCLLSESNSIFPSSLLSKSWDIFSKFLKKENPVATVNPVVFCFFCTNWKTRQTYSLSKHNSTCVLLKWNDTLKIKPCTFLPSVDLVVFNVTHTDHTVTFKDDKDNAQLLLFIYLFFAKNKCIWDLLGCLTSVYSSIIHHKCSGKHACLESWNQF